MTLDSLVPRISTDLHNAALAAQLQALVPDYANARVWGYAAGDFTNDSLPDLALSLYDPGRARSEVRVYFFENVNNRSLVSRLEKEIPFVESPIEVGLSIDGSVVTFPPSAGGHPLVLVIGFSHKAATQCDAWVARVKPLSLERRVEYYELADFQGVPSFVMRLILHGVRRSVPEDEHAHFAPFYSGEDAWEKLVGYSSPEDAYVILADRSGRVLWQAHGPETGQKYSDLMAVLTKEPVRLH